MERLGARRVPITYVQPALSEESSPSGRLMLISFPLDGETSLADGEWSLEAAVVAEFLREYYRACGVENLEDDPDLVRMEAELAEFDGGIVQLVELVGASLRFKRFGIVLHFVRRLGEAETAEPGPERLDPFQSFEEDLSDCLKRIRRRFEWYLPNVFHYPSERELFDTGEQTRSLTERREALRARTDEIDARWKLAVERRRSLGETVRNVLLAALSIVTTIHDVQGTFYRVLAICAYAVLIFLYVQSHPAWSWARLARLFRRGHA
jgi:hypothetical protein